MRNTKEFRTEDLFALIIDGEPMFVADDVCRALGIQDSMEAFSLLDDEDKDVIIIDTVEGEEKIPVVSKFGLCSLIFSSKEPEAKSFKHWIENDDLPEIFKSVSSMEDLLIIQGELLLEHEERLQKLEQQTLLSEQIPDFIEENEETVEPEDYLTVEGYARLKDISVSRSVAQHLGRKAKKLSKARDVETGVTEFGHKAFRIDILDDVFAAYET